MAGIRWLTGILGVLLLVEIGYTGFENPPLKVCLVSGSAEYESEKSLPLFQTYLETNYNVVCTLIQADGFEELPGTENLETCDAALFFTRRLRITGEALERIKQYCSSGKPIVAVRTASHGFQNWLEMDKLILGGNYHGHFGDGPTQNLSMTQEAKKHPVMHGVLEFGSRYSLYKTLPLADDCTVLMNASIPGEEPQPAAWVREHNGGRVFYTSVGGLQDFENSSFKRLLANALFWTAGREVEKHPQKIVDRRQKPSGTIVVPLRKSIELYAGSGRWVDVIVEQEFPIAETAILLCDMWDQHWCQGATERCGQLAVELNRMISIARDRGVQIIHSPSDTMGFYTDYPQRLRAQQAPAVQLPDPLDVPDCALPIDDSDGGCDTDDKPWYKAWTRQHPAIEIGEFDIISDNGDEIYHFLEQEGIRTILYTGVHTNMCVLGRSFAIRRMTRLGKQCVLVRDMTDAMYDPKDYPYVSHDEGTQLVVKYIEQNWCPTITSQELIKGLP